MRSFLGSVEGGGGSFGHAAPLPWHDGAMCVFCLGLLLSLLPDNCVWCWRFSTQGAARNPEDMDRERREHEREERMGQLRGSATRALPPGPPAGATANRLRNVTEPMASTPTSRIQQSGEGVEELGEGATPVVGWKSKLLTDILVSTFLCPNRQHIPQSNLKSGQGAEGQHEVTPRSSCQRLLI